MYMKLIKEKLIPVYECFKTYLFPSKVSLNLDNSKKNIYIFLCPDYGNIGDIAIGYAQKNFILKSYPNYNIVEIPISNTYDYIRLIKKNIKKNDIIVLIGGGNFGDMYPKADFMRLFIIKTFKNNKIVSFPQTFNFSNNKYGQRRLFKNIKIINKHKNIILFAREKVSYDLMKKYFPNKELYLCPDIVLSLNMVKTSKRDGVLFAFRSDNEKKISDKFIDSLKEFINNKKEEVVFKDTTIPNEEFICDERMDYLNTLLSEFSKSKMVITDRLHGMIFSYITSTPCIVLANNNHKIISTYNTWLKDCNYIKFISDLDNINSDIDELLSLKNISKIDFKDKYNELKKCFK